MPEFEKGAEAEWHEERRRPEKEQERTAWDAIQKVLEEYNGDPWQIPTEELAEYKENAQHFVETAENDDAFNPPERLVNLAEEILKVPE